MATLFLEPSGDADFGDTMFWPTGSGIPAAVSDFVHGGHLRSIKYRPGQLDYNVASNTVADAGGRANVWIYLNALPTGTTTFMALEQTGDGAYVARVRLTSGGILQLWEKTNQIGSNGSALKTGRWYRLCLAWTITSTTVNQFRLFIQKAAVSSTDITVSNATLTNVTSADFQLGNASTDATFDLRTSDHYIDDSSSLTDPGEIWVTAKRPNANGTTNGFTTQIGSGGSGYGTGHSPQINERPNSDSNGWSIVTVASAITEEYNIENLSTGDFNLTGATIVDYMGWIRSKALASETAQIIVNGVNSNIALTSTITLFKKFAGSSTYPAGTGSDIGEISAAVATTISLYECGIIVAFKPAVAQAGWKTLLGSGR